jgi:hypothetical protein
VLLGFEVLLAIGAFKMAQKCYFGGKQVPKLLFNGIWMQKNDRCQIYRSLLIFVCDYLNYLNHELPLHPTNSTSITDQITFAIKQYLIV